MCYIYILDCPKKYSDAPVSKLSKCINPSLEVMKLKPFTTKKPLKNNVISENSSCSIINDSIPSTQITSYQSNCIYFHRINVQS